MSTELALSGKLREQKGKGASRRLRSKGDLPAVLYGQKNNLSLAVNPRELKKILSQKGKNALIQLSVEGDSKKNRTVLLKNYQTHPLRTDWTHVDFLEIDMAHKIKIDVPLHFIGVSAGEKKGGIANHILRALHVECFPADIPEFIEVQMTGVDLNQVIHVSDLKASDKIRILNHPTEAVVSVFQEKEEVATPVVTAEGAAVPGEAAPATAEGDAKAAGKPGDAKAAAGKPGDAKAAAGKPGDAKAAAGKPAAGKPGK